MDKLSVLIIIISFCTKLWSQNEYLVDNFEGYDCSAQYKGPPPPEKDRVFSVDQALACKSARIVLSLRDAGSRDLATDIPRLRQIKNLYSLIIDSPPSTSPAYYCFNEVMVQHNVALLTKELSSLESLRYLTITYPDSMLLSEICRRDKLKGLKVIINNRPVPAAITNLKCLETLMIIGFTHNGQLPYSDSIFTLPNLRVLFIPISDSCNLDLLSSNTLTDLTLIGGRKSFKSIESLNHLTKLSLYLDRPTRLTIPCCVKEFWLVGRDLDTCVTAASPQQLEKIYIGVPFQLDSLPEWVEKSTNIKRLWIRNYPIARLSGAVHNFKRLEFLVTYSSEDLTVENTSCLSGFTALKFLAIINDKKPFQPSIHIRSTEHLKKCTDLKTLYLFNVELADSCGTEYLTVNELYIDRPSFNASINEILKLKRLSKITIIDTQDGTAIDDNIVKLKAGFPKIQITQVIQFYQFADISQMFNK